MSNKHQITSNQPFNVDYILETLSAYPERDYAVIARMASKLITKDTIDLTNLGSDLTWTDMNQMLGGYCNKSIYISNVIDLIQRRGINSPEYQFAVERRLRQSINAVVRGVKKKHDEEDRKIINNFLEAYNQPKFNTWKNKLNFEVEKSDSFTSDNSVSYLENQEVIEEDNSIGYFVEVIEQDLYSEANDFDYELDLDDIPF